MRIKLFHIRTSHMLRLILFAGILTISAWSLRLTPVRAAQQGVSLELLPSTVQLKPNKPVDVLLILRNPTTAALENIDLTWVTSLDITMEHDSYNTNLPAGGLLSLKVTVTPPEEQPVAGEVYFQFMYSQIPQEGNAPTRETVTAALAIEDPTVELVEDMAELRIETALDQIEEQRSGQVFLVVHNLANRPIWITKVTALKPEFVILGDVDLAKEPKRLTEQELLTESQDVAPQETYVLTIPVSLTGEVQPGQHRLLFNVDLQWERDGQQSSGSLVAAHTINAGILGESDLLKLVGAPSILFLPGFLMLTMFVMLSGRLPPRTQFNLSPAEFALFSISLSLMTALAYPRITGSYGGESRNYLQAYGLTDIFLVWFGSIAVGFASWAVFFGLTAVGKKLSSVWQGYLARRAEKERLEEMARRIPQFGDNPVQTLEKMGMNDIRLPLEEAEIDLHGHPIRGFILLQEPGDASAVWVSPPILLKPREEPGMEEDQYREMRNRHLEQITAAQSARELAAALGYAADTWDIVWNERGALDGPKRVLQAELRERRRSARPFVEPE